MRNIPFLAREYIESEAEALLEGYGKKYGAIYSPPIPADDILNVYLRVSLDFDNLPRLLGTESDVFGATWIERGQVIIDQSLDPTNHPERIGRYNFTVGHETGHWQLHRRYFVNDSNQAALFEEAQLQPTVVCRTSQAKEPIEWQADYFASSLLMPQAMLRRCWRAKHEVVGTSIEDIRQKLRANDIKSDDAVIERFVKPLARDFAVSPIAMRIRVENLGLVARQSAPSLFAVSGIT